MSVTVRISDQLRETLRQLSTQQGVSMHCVMEQAVEHYRRRCMLESLNAAYARLTPEALAESDAEDREWDGVLLDGLDE